MNIEKDISPYFKPDERWPIFGAKTLEEYIDKYVVKGKFHCNVHADIQDAWKTVEYLLAHAYYHWPMYDEGFKKALLIIEMAVKLKAKELGIALKEKSKKGKEFDRKLVDVINSVFNGEHYHTLKSDIHRARSIRNKQMHPDSNSYMGGMGVIPSNLKLFVNIINAIFRDDKWHNKQLKTNKNIAERLGVLGQFLLVLENNKPGILIHEITRFKVLDSHLLLACNPIRTDISKIINGHYSTNAIILSIQNFEISDVELVGKSVDGWPIRLYKTDKEENILTLKNYLQQIESCDTNNKLIHFHGLQQNTAWDLVQREYENIIGLAT
jgi:hypothetical protein